MDKKQKIENISIACDASILSALKKMDNTYKRLLLVFKENQFINVISIGDIQRAIIRNQSLDTVISKILRRETRVAKINDSFCFIKSQMLKYKAECMPVSVIFGMHGKCYLHGHLSGSIRKYMHMSPSSFLYWEMYKYSKAMGLKYLHLGGGYDGADDNPLLKFKMNFSKNTFDFFIAKKVHNPKIYNQILNQWQSKYPNLYNQFKEQVLCYHNISS